MGTHVKELDNRHDGDRGACPICAPKRGRISESDLWQWAQAEWERKGGRVNPLR